MDIGKDLGALLITNPTNIRYLTGFVGVAENEREAYSLLTRDSLYFFTSALYIESARNVKCPTRLPDGQVPNVQRKLVEFSREEPFAKKLKEILDPISRNRNAKVGFDEDDLKVSEYNTFSKVLKGITLIPTKNRIEKVRMIKREDEIDNIREAARFN